MRLTAAASILSLLAACDQPDPAREQATAAPEFLPAEAPAAAAGPLAPDAIASPAYVGRWAVEPGLCEDGAFVFTADALVTAGEVACDWDQVVREGDGWTLNARCTAEGPPRPAILRLAPAGEGALRIEGAPFAPVTVRRCAS